MSMPFLPVPWLAKALVVIIMACWLLRLGHALFTKAGRSYFMDWFAFVFLDRSNVERRGRRLARAECKAAGKHLQRELISREGRWDNETEHTDWNNYQCLHCGQEFFQYVDSRGVLIGREDDRQSKGKP